MGTRLPAKDRPSADPLQVETKRASIRRAAQHRVAARIAFVVALASIHGTLPGVVPILTAFLSVRPGLRGCDSARIPALQRAITQRFAVRRPGRVCSDRQRLALPIGEFAALKILIHLDSCTGAASRNRPWPVRPLAVGLQELPTARFAPLAVAVAVALIMAGCSTFSQAPVSGAEGAAGAVVRYRCDSGRSLDASYSADNATVRYAGR